MPVARRGLDVEADTETYAPVTVIRLSGELDFGTAPVLLRRVRPYCVDGGLLVLDLSGVDLCDSSGLGALVSLHDEAAANGRLALAALRPQVSKAVTYTALDQLLTITPDVESAVAAARGSGGASGTTP